MMIVKNSEGRLLRWLKDLLNPYSNVGVFRDRQPVESDVPPESSGVTRACADLVQATLAKGITQWLIRAGGWRTNETIREGEQRRGNVWSRWPADSLGLEFSVDSLRLIHHFAGNSVEQAFRWRASRRGEGHMPLGDQLLLFILFTRTLDLKAKPPHWQRVFNRSALCRLARPDLFSSAKLDIEPWLEQPGLSVLESIQNKLSLIWAKLEFERGNMSVERLLDAGDRQRATWDALFSTCRDRSCVDLTMFAISSARLVLLEKRFRNADGVPQLREWMRSAPYTRLRLNDRQRAIDAALTLQAIAVALGEWTERERHTSFLDEDYQAAQQWLLNWESAGADSVVEAAAKLLESSRVF
ncbi:MAG: hypothetical protein QGG36_18250 [Pirellulaceae bacterium]|jgi:hypothetical protein|nr:hypothetical protein [Pirellulaceae bacterium]MDP7017752.1 hypothetical protein [Pirellulaceae bacterium]